MYHVMQTLVGLSCVVIGQLCVTSPVCAEQQCSFNLQGFVKDASHPGKSHSCIGPLSCIPKLHTS